MPRYNPAVIEPKWQQFWEDQHTFGCPRLPAGEKLYVLDMFPYPSGDGLHVGHPEGYTATDIVARHARMGGKSVLHPMGFDAFGLPAEEHAIKTNTPPRVQTEKNIENFRRQLKMLGFSYDWQRELSTTDVAYFRWTQWIFLQIYDTWFDEDQQRGRPIAELPIPDQVGQQGADAVRVYQDEHRLAYQSEAPVNWCPALGTVLANEEVVDGKSERGGHPVVRMPLRQWMLRITAYAERLEKDLEGLDWPDSIKALQRNWIGRSTGAEVDFYIGPPDGYDRWRQVRQADGFPRQPSADCLRVYTTRPDTLFGATYMVIAPEHPAVDTLTTPAQATAVDAYRQQAARKSDLDRTDLAKEKTGVFTGSSAINPVNGESIPIWIADYVLISYGTGAIMAVPAHDQRDFEFAVQFQIPIRAVVDPGQDLAEATREEVLAARAVFTGEGIAVNSAAYDGLATAKFKQQIAEDLAAKGQGRAAVNYKLRDWLFSRQRFWGEPFPVLHELDADGQPTGVVRPVPTDQLPVDLPPLEDFKPHGRPEPPLDKAPPEWLYPVIDGTRYKRETNTMPQWAGSCWYYLRFLDPQNEKCLVDPEVEQAWMPVDLYIGGAEHAVLHLLYARFWHKVLYDLGYVSTAEPFTKLFNQGMIRSFAYRDGRGVCVPYKDVEYTDDGPKHKRTGEPLTETVEKMSKSLKNVINPDDVIAEYGADTFRLYEMYMGPLEASKPWNTRDVPGVHRFLHRAWRLIADESTGRLSSAVRDVSPGEASLRLLHRMIREVEDDIETLRFNTAIAHMIVFVNEMTGRSVRPKSVLEQFVLALAPFAPHVAEELWQLLGHDKSLAYERWPTYDPSLAREGEVEIAVQVNGKVRSRIRIRADATEEEMKQAAMADGKIREQIGSTSIRRMICVPGRLVNIVVGTRADG